MTGKGMDAFLAVAEEVAGSVSDVELVGQPRDDTSKEVGVPDVRGGEMV